MWSIVSIGLFNLFAIVILKFRCDISIWLFLCLLSFHTIYSLGVIISCFVYLLSNILFFYYRSDSVCLKKINIETFRI